MRVFPGGEVAIIHLGDVPLLLEELQPTIQQATWNAARGEVSLRLSVYNDGEGIVHLPADYVRITSQGGDVPFLLFPMLPMLIESKETVVIDVTFVPNTVQNVHLIIQNNLWEITGFLEMP